MVLAGIRAAAQGAIVAIVFVSAPDVARAQESRTAYAPITFTAEAGPIRTAACLQLTERVYESTRWWETAAAASGSDRAFKAVMAAIKQQDRAGLLKLTDPAQAKDTASFDQQANAFFRQFASIQLVDVPRAHEFDGLVAYFARVQFEGQTGFVPFVFAFQGQDSFGFLPSRSTAPAFTLVTEWFVPTLSAPAQLPPYCADSDVKRATHRLSLGSSSWRPSAVLLIGARLDAPGPLAAVATAVKSTIDQMKAAVRGATIDDLFRHMTPIGGERLKQWFATAPQAERDAYNSALSQHQPFFVFDATPLLVVFTRTAERRIEVLYFTVAADKRLLWTNASYMTTADKLFKQGSLLAAASSTPPFKTLAIK